MNQFQTFLCVLLIRARQTTRQVAFSGWLFMPYYYWRNGTCNCAFVVRQQIAALILEQTNTFFGAFCKHLGARALRQQTEQDVLCSYLRFQTTPKPEQQRRWNHNNHKRAFLAWFVRWTTAAIYSGGMNIWFLDFLSIPNEPEPAFSINNHIWFFILDILFFQHYIKRAHHRWTDNKTWLYKVGLLYTRPVFRHIWNNKQTIF